MELCRWSPGLVGSVQRIRAQREERTTMVLGQLYKSKSNEKSSGMGTYVLTLRINSGTGRAKAIGRIYAKHEDASRSILPRWAYTRQRKDTQVLCWRILHECSTVNAWQEDLYHNYWPQSILRYPNHNISGILSFSFCSGSFYTPEFSSYQQKTSACIV